MTAPTRRDGRRGREPVVTAEQAAAEDDAARLLREAYLAFHARVAAQPGPPAPAPDRAVLPIELDGPARSFDEAACGRAEAGAYDRVVIHNWNSDVGFVPVGQMKVEIEPGQAVTLWVSQTDPTPTTEFAEAQGRRLTFAMLVDEEVLIY